MRVFFISQLHRCEELPRQLQLFGELAIPPHHAAGFLWDHFIPVNVIPSINRFCASRKATIKGVTITVAVAIIGP
jgi:hypothetical protein